MKQYIVDTFTDKLFSGNPAAVCMVEQELSEEIMLKIAIENNLSKMAFVIMNYIDKTLKEVVFSTMSGNLKVVKNNKFYEMDFPVYDLKKTEITRDLIDALSIKPKEVLLQN